MRARRLFLLLGVLLATACSGLTGPGYLAGTWTQGGTFPGNSLQFTLNTDGDAVSGSGTWSGEACCDGTVTITGTVSGNDVTLSLLFVTRGGGLPPRTSQFTGKVMVGGTMVGVFGSGSDSVVFHRTS